MVGDSARLNRLPKMDMAIQFSASKSDVKVVFLPLALEVKNRRERARVLTSIKIVLGEIGSLRQKRLFWF